MNERNYLLNISLKYFKGTKIIQSITFVTTDMLSNISLF